MKDEKLFSIKPEFVFGKNLLLNSLIWLPISIAAGVEAAVIYVAATKGNFPSLFLYSFGPAAVIFLFLMVLGFFNEKQNAKATEYAVYDNRIELAEGFLNSQITNLLLEDVKEIHLKRSVFQKIWDLGTIRFITAANSQQALNPGIFSTGVNFRDIKNPAKIYTEMKKLVEAQRKKY